MEKITKGHPLTQSPDFVKENIEILKNLFPTIVKEDKIDFDELKAILVDDLETDEEYYRFTWAGKSMARREATKPSTATLRPCKDDSKNWDKTRNIFIEGDNLEVLKLLQKSYANKIKMIYIDPPYNTGKDFVYKDNYKDNLGNYLELTGQTDEEGKKLSTNTESDGRYHSNWLNMMYPRLKLARTLLSDDGVIFISIDDNEVTNLMNVCYEIFGEENFIGQLGIKANPRGRQSDNYIANIHDFLLCFSKSIKNVELDGLPLTQEDIDDFDQIDENGEPWRELGLRQRGSASLREDRPDMFFPIFVNPETMFVSLERNSEYSIEVLPKKADGREGRWMWGKDKTKNEISRVYARLIKRRNEYDIFIKDYLNKVDGIRTKKPKSFWLEKEVNTEVGGKIVKELFNASVFPYPKPVGLLLKVLTISTLNNDIIMDFFAGSCTTAHSIFQLNAEDRGSRKFICVQLPELTESKSEAYKAGFKNIAEIGKERIRRAGEKILEEKREELTKLKTKVEGTILLDDLKQQIEEQERIIETLDVGFKVFKLDSSNINAWDGDPEKLEQTLFNAASNIKENRTEDDILYEILLKYGLDLAQPIEQRIISNKTVFNIGGGVLFICLADNITTDIADGIGKWKNELNPATCKVLFKDSGFNDVDKTNSMQILKRYGIEEVNTI